MLFYRFVARTSFYSNDMVFRCDDSSWKCLQKQALLPKNISYFYNFCEGLVKPPDILRRGRAYFLICSFKFVISPSRNLTCSGSVKKPALAFSRYSTAFGKLA